MTNREFANTNELFRKACEKAGVKPTVRQASKFLNGHGIAFGFKSIDKPTE